MPAKAKTLKKVAKKLGFQKTRQKGSHARLLQVEHKTLSLMKICFFTDMS
jgi:predicted RNA binding protein YcfA (HicA-like mRNA interferase family)